MINWFNSSNPDLFDNMIKDASNAFANWRYVFDYGTKDGIKVNPQFLRGFRVVLREVCCEEICGLTWNEYTNKQ